MITNPRSNNSQDDPIQAGHGLLFIGDPHAASRRPGRRKDDYAATIVVKLRQAIEIANARDLQPILLGDLFDRAGDTDPALLVGLCEVFTGAVHRPLALAGNHDIRETRLTSDTALAILHAAGVLDVIAQVQTRSLAIAGFSSPVSLLAIPYGCEIPRTLPAALAPGTRAIAITHADLAFPGYYSPAAIDPFEIEGVDLVVNGHIHLTLPEIRRGQTLWRNPGNIARVGIDALGHEPSVWSWGPDRPCELVRHRLEFAPGEEIFDLTGRQVEALPMTALGASEFVAALKSEAALDAARTDTGAILAEDINAVLDDLVPVGKDETGAAGAQDSEAVAVRSMVLELMRRATAGAAA